MGLVIFIAVRFLLIILCFFTFNNVYSQITIPAMASQYAKTIDSAITLVQKTDIEVYNRLDSVCDGVDLWLGSFSSCSDKIIYISRNDVLLGVQNVAAVLVHESKHLWIWKQQIKLEIEQEEAMCYKYELEFLNKVPNCSWELKKHAVNFIIEFGSPK